MELVGESKLKWEERLGGLALREMGLEPSGWILRVAEFGTRMVGRTWGKGTGMLPISTKD